MQSKATRYIAGVGSHCLDSTASLRALCDLTRALNTYCYHNRGPTGGERTGGLTLIASVHSHAIPGLWKNIQLQGLAIVCDQHKHKTHSQGTSPLVLALPNHCSTELLRMSNKFMHFTRASSNSVIQSGKVPSSCTVHIWEQLNTRHTVRRHRMSRFGA